MSANDDAAYAAHLLATLRSDQARLASEPAHRAIVLWMVEELRAAAASLRIDHETAKALVAQAADARRAAMAVREQNRTSRKRRAA